jgi:hypothetical protein
MIARQGLTVWRIIGARDRKTFARNEFFSFWTKTDLERVWPALTTCMHVTLAVRGASRTGRLLTQTVPLLKYR